MAEPALKTGVTVATSYTDGNTLVFVDHYVNYVVWWGRDFFVWVF